MEINVKGKYEPKAGDILSWINGTDEILFVVTDNCSDQITGITLRDNRNINDGKSHLVIFQYDNWKLALMLKNEKTNLEDDLDTILAAWDNE